MIKKILYTPFDSSYTIDRFNEYNLFHVLGDAYTNQFIQSEEELIAAKNITIGNALKDNSILHPDLSSVIYGRSISTNRMVITIDI